jgi:aminoglycoside phosphotransferase (APT) family kinase protein
MTGARMHPDELDIDVALVERLVAAQFPEWAALPLERVESAGTVNAIYRLGEEMAVRLPRRAAWTGGFDKERHWLPRLAPHLPLAIPEPLAHGEPGEGYPLPWAVYRWLEGEVATPGHIDQSQAALDLAGFILALQRIDPADGPRPSAENYQRGVPLGTRDGGTRRAIGELEGRVDTAAALEAWEVALLAPEWERPPTWLHGDLMPGNLLVRDARISAVIDWGALAVGDPACDLMPAWNLLEPDAREVFRGALGADDATWARGRGWALSVAVIALPYYWETNPEFAAIARRTLTAVLEDHARARG